MREFEHVTDFAHGVLTADTLEGKLTSPPARLPDDGPPIDPVPDLPGRPAGLEIATSSAKKRKVPPIEGMPDPAQRVRILHGLANHEFQAVELFAWALLKFHDAPVRFRRGLLRILAEEQEHMRLYLERIAAHGGRFGDEPLSGYFWSKVGDLTTPVRFVCSMALTFESANLDHAVELCRAAREAGDPQTAEVLEKVHVDELDHVRFGWLWLKRFKRSEQSMTEAYLDNIAWPLRPMLARGPVFHRDSRERAGLDHEFIQLLEGAIRPKALYRFEKFRGASRGADD